jgi:hypothetical protein
VNVIMYISVPHRVVVLPQSSPSSKAGGGGRTQLRPAPMGDIIENADQPIDEVSFGIELASEALINVDIIRVKDRIEHEV